MAKKTLFTCSNCEISNDGSLFPVVHKVVPNYFIGSKRVAKALGWTEAEYGSLCPECSIQQAEHDKLNEQEGAQTTIGGLLNNMLAKKLVKE